MLKSTVSVILLTVPSSRNGSRTPYYHQTEALPSFYATIALREAFPAIVEVATNHAGRLTVRIVGDVYEISAVYVNFYYQILMTHNILSVKRMNDQYQLSATRLFHITGGYSSYLASPIIRIR